MNTYIVYLQSTDQLRIEIDAEDEESAEDHAGVLAEELYKLRSKEFTLLRIASPKRYGWEPLPKVEIVEVRKKEE